ncbi:Hsp20/alpha crystallin family protein [Thiohalophilus thiocyanatoxydans]|uniref:Heat shock protein Hsp20 n=1 Tax=Thiohalophilus thiocyanatoxydans TaxID=381308 RepID=A0A4R8IGG8_9GAMM|nr:Hsp20/alpha crystallin family protein [Thiohalophilus thiocyanatoxydans]TDX99665.1 heat shock protein Hsp20 [Thiohalophilus thiocyanatoxydans]
MNAMAELQQGLNRAWHSLSEGWTQLRDRAANAITRFNPVKHDGEVESAEDVGALRGARWSVLAAEVQDKGDDLVVRLEVPGMEADDFDIAVVDDYLLVRGEKRLQREQTEGDFHIRERAYGAFQRAVPLPTAVDQEKAKAQYKRGVLNVTLPKASHARRRKIEVGS